MPGVLFIEHVKHWNSSVIVVGDLFSDERGHLKRFQRDPEKSDDVRAVILAPGHV